MTEAILNNILQAANQDFSPAKKNKSQNSSAKSFSETMQEINQQRQRQKKSEKTATGGGAAAKEKSDPISNQEFLAKLKEILSKNKKEVPSELLSLLEGGSLNSQQKAMLEKLMLNLQNNNLDVSELKSLLAKNKDNQKAVNSEDIKLFQQEENSKNLDFKSLNSDQLEKLASSLKTGDQKLTDGESSKLKAELDQLVKIILNSNPEADKNQEANLKQILGTENLQTKLTELASFLKESDFSSEEFAAISEQNELKLPLLTQAIASESLDFSKMGANLSSENNSSLGAEFAAQIKEMLNDENNQSNNQNPKADLSLNNSDLFSLNNDSVLDLAFEGGKLENKNQNNFFDLDNSNLLFNFDQENQTTANNNLNLENFTLNSQNTAKLAKNTDLRAQVVEQFKGQYSPETKELQIQLKPESLGKIDISLSYDNEQLTGKMLVESEIVRAQLENSLKGLKTDLLKQGINIEQFKIETAKTAPQQVEKQDEFAFDDQSAAFSDGETGENQEYEQRQFFQGQYYVQKNNGNSSLDSENVIMRQQEIINRAAFSNENINLLA